MLGRPHRALSGAQPEMSMQQPGWQRGGIPGSVCALAVLLGFCAAAGSSDASVAVVGVPAARTAALVRVAGLPPRVQLADIATPDPALWRTPDAPHIDPVPLFTDPVLAPSAPARASVAAPRSTAAAELAQALRTTRQGMASGEIAALDGEGMCLAEAVYFESRGQPLAGQLAVAQVILNRTADKRFAPSVCGVVRERSKSGTCQFSFVCDARSDVPGPSASWDEARAIAALALTGDMPDVTGGKALFFHATHAAPAWRLRMAKTATLGTHLFYRPR